MFRLVKKTIPLFILGLSITQVQAQDADKIFINGQIYTAVDGAPLQQAIAIYQDRILQVGSNDDIQALANTETQIIDLKNGVVLPGLIDSHLHPLMGGIESVTANMHDEYVDIKALEARVKAFQQEGSAKAGDMLVINGMSSEQWSHLDDLNTVFNQGEWAITPIALVGSDHHTSWANNALLQRANVTPEYIQSIPAAEQENIGHDKDFKPNGFLVDSGWDYVSNVIPELDDDLMYKGGLAGINLLNSYGVTAWLDVAMNALPNRGLFNISNTEKTVGMLPLYKKLSEDGALTVHAAGLQVINSKSTANTLDLIEKISSQYANINNVKLIGVKVFADGVIEYPAQSAALMGDYNNSHKSGELLFDPEVFTQLVDVADKKGIVVHTHAIGDRAVHESLNAIEFARKNRNSHVPHTITHLQLVAPQDYKRFKELNVIAAMQLLWAYPDDYIQQMVKPYIDKEAYLGMYPALSLLNNGATIAGASDYPVSTPNPFPAMAVAMTRMNDKGETLNADEAIDLDSLLKAYTINSAKALNWSDEIGSLEVGKKADMILLDRNIFELESKPSELAETQVLWTLFEGDIVYKASNE